MPLIIVSDASPIRALDHVGLLSLCGDLYGTVIVPEAVRLELLRPTLTCAAIDIRNQSGFKVQIPSATPTALGVPADLDPGESEAIALAIELRADLVLMDERKATQAARQMGLATIGVIGILLEAKQRGLVGGVMPVVDQLVTELNFFVSPALRLRVAQLAGE